MMTFHVLGRPAVDCLDIAQCPMLTNEAVWIDLFEPTKEEEKTVEAALGIDVPTREHMQEIESSSRLRRENGVLFMTSQVLSQRVANGRRRFVVCHGAARHRFEKLRKLVDESMPDSAERRRVHRER